MIHPKEQPITGRPIRFAIVGCGRISKNHIAAIEKHVGDAELVAVCDANADIVGPLSRQMKIPGYTSLNKLLAESNADVVALCTPSGMHAEQAIQVARAGRHVMSEKPMATRWADGKRMVAECDQAGVFLFVVKQNRHNATLQMLKNAVDTGRFGRIYMVTINVFWTRPQDYYSQASWRGTWEFDGGAFMNQASHYVDMLDWMIGPIESIQAYTGTLARNIQVEDTGVMSIKWRSGALGTMNVTMLTYPKNLEGSITVIGEKGTARVGGVAVNEIQHWEFADKLPEDEKIRQVNYETTSVYGHGHTAYYENVIKTLRGEQTPLTDGREGLKSLEVLIATYIAARDGRRVSIPLDY
jgi:UDP-N-acetyl-2-amino-2-deoxyglucuronate dehydrogenase